MFPFDANEPTLKQPNPFTLLYVLRHVNHILYSSFLCQTTDVIFQSSKTKNFLVLSFPLTATNDNTHELSKNATNFASTELPKVGPKRRMAKRNSRGLFGSCSTGFMCEHIEANVGRREKKSCALDVPFRRKRGRNNSRPFNACIIFSPVSTCTLIDFFLGARVGILGEENWILGF